MRRSLDDFGHEALDIIEIRLATGQKQLGDILPFPVADTCLPVRRDVRNVFAERTSFGSRASEVQRSIRHSDEISRRMTIATQRNVLH